MQLFARLVLDRIGITLQAIHVALQPIIFELQYLHLLTKQVCLLPLLLIYSQPVRAKYDVISDSNGERRCSKGRSFSPANRDSLAGRKELHHTSGLLDHRWLQFYLFS